MIRSGKESSPVSGTGKGLEGQLGGDPGRLGQANGTWWCSMSRQWWQRVRR